MRFYEPTKGRITLDGKNLKDFRQQDLRRQIGIVQQDVFLFSDSIAENISYGKENATNEEIEEAARLAAADSFINNLPEGYHTKVGERGVKLSGGQKRRAALLRALWAGCDTLLLDEPFTGMDPETMKKAAALLKERRGERAVLLATHDREAIRELGWRVIDLT